MLNTIDLIKVITIFMLSKVVYHISYIIQPQPVEVSTRTAVKKIKPISGRFKYQLFKTNRC